jgi:hypothetical protein
MDHEKFIMVVNKFNKSYIIWLHVFVKNTHTHTHTHTYIYIYIYKLALYILAICFGRNLNHQVKCIIPKISVKAMHIFNH